jgi:uncharacterized protein (TIGR02452 family)
MPIGNEFCEPVFANTLEITKYITVNTTRHQGLINDFVVNHDKNTIFEVKNIDCINECINLRDKYPDKKIGLLNNASEFNRGGGVKKGAMAQEEDICRKTSLYRTLMAHEYPINPDEILYSRNVVIVKDQNLKELSNFVKIDGVLSSAALRRPQLSKELYMYNSDRSLMRNKIRLILQTACYYELEVLVLGGYGCGAFRNPAREVAKLFKTVLDKEFKNSFDHVVFAILENPHHEILNQVFSEVLLN